MDLRDKIPSIYHSIFPELLSIEFPEERIATCENCTLCRSVNSPYIGTKCCDYHPHLANFLIGAIFIDDEINLAEGKERIKAQILARSGITPYGIIPPVPYSIRQKEIQSQEFWSRSHELIESQRCPYYDKGNCTVWKYRENLCVTHFCTSIGGAPGNLFWGKVNKYLKMAETSLAQYAMLQLGWPASKIKTETFSTDDFNIENEEGVVNDANYKKLWGEWAGREEEFYRNCYEIIKNTDAPTFKKITGLKREILESSIRETQKGFQHNIIPDYLILHPDLVTEFANEGFTRLVLGETSAEIPSVIYPLLRGFNGNRQSVEVFHLGFNVLYNMGELVNELREKGILIKR